MWLANLSKTIALALILVLATSSIMLVGSSSEQSIPKPSIPEFTISVTDHSYDVPTTTTTTTDLDGRIITKTTPGYHAINGSITLSIKNQPFTPYYDSDGYPINLYYHIRVKGLVLSGYIHPVKVTQAAIFKHLTPRIPQLSLATRDMGLQLVGVIRLT